MTSFCARSMGALAVGDPAPTGLSAPVARDATPGPNAVVGCEANRPDVGTRSGPHPGGGFFRDQSPSENGPALRDSSSIRTRDTSPAERLPGLVVRADVRRHLDEAAHVCRNYPSGGSHVPVSRLQTSFPRAQQSRAVPSRFIDRTTEANSEARPAPARLSRPSVRCLCAGHLPRST